MFGGVPIRVSVPPKLLAKASGISRRPGLISALAARLTTIGSITATVPVLLTNAPINEVASITVISSLVSFVPASFSMRLLAIRARPVWNIAPPTTNKPIIIITTELEKPASASPGVNMPSRTRAINEQIATRSDLILPFMNSAAAITRITSVRIMSVFMPSILLPTWLQSRNSVFILFSL
ncbi:hypothetical protein D3C78_1271590 [compost metagenome]